MATSVIDLSGRGGLADKWAGELVSPTTVGSNNNYTLADGEMMSGVFNPIKRKGYLSPSVGTFETVTPGVSFTVLMAASQVDEINSDVYFFENGTKIHKADTFDDLALADDRTITSAVGTDLAIYTINGNRSLFYAYESSATSKIGVKDIAVTTAAVFTADAATDYLTYTDTNFIPSDTRVIFLTTTGTLPAGLATSTAYYIRDTDINNLRFKVSLTSGGAAVDITGAGTGTHTISQFVDDIEALYMSGAVALAKSKTKLIPSGDGFLYVLAKNNVYRVDGTSVGGANGTISAALLTAPGHYFLSHGIDYRGNLYIVVQKNILYQSQFLIADNANSFNSEVGVYIWNRQSTFFNTSDFIPILGVRSIHSIFIAPNGKIRVICRASNGTTQIREFNGTSFVVLKEMGITAYPNYEDSVTVVGNFTVWLGSDTRLYYFGTESPGQKEILFIAGILNAATTGKGGAIAYADGGTLQSDGLDSFYTSYHDGSSFLVRKVSPNSDGTYNSAAVNRHTGDVVVGTKLLPRLSTVKHIDIYFATLAVQSAALTTEEATLLIFFNNSAAAWATKSITRADLNKGLFSIEVNKPFINSIQFQVRWNANSISNTDFCPSHAVVTYETTNTLK